MRIVAPGQGVVVVRAPTPAGNWVAPGWAWVAAVAITGLVVWRVIAANLVPTASTPAQNPTAAPRPVVAPTRATSTAAQPTARLTATPLPPATLTVGQEWDVLERQLAAGWGSDWLWTIGMLDGFLADFPQHPGATLKLYGALVSHGNSLVAQGSRASGASQLVRARNLLPNRPEAQSALHALTPPPTRSPTLPPRAATAAPSRVPAPPRTPTRAPPAPTRASTARVLLPATAVRSPTQARPAATRAPTVLPVPAAPSNLQVTATGRTTFQLDWKDNSGTERGFYIADNVDGSRIIATTPANMTRWGVGGVSAGTRRCFTVQAFNDRGTSAWATWVCGTTLQ